MIGTVEHIHIITLSTLPTDQFGIEGIAIVQDGTASVLGNLNIILESFRRSIPIDELLVVGGGAKGALWCQMMADVYNARIKVPVLLEEATSMGAAVTGGVGVGVFKGFEVIDQMLELNRTVEPDPEAVAAYGPVKEAFEVCYKAMLPVYEYMASHKNA